ncbi:MAG: hypothetical protein HY063_13955 [Bacteroidetes bacterium]|nr:hypothetical protein [Bacteroidota bacterium]
MKKYFLFLFLISFSFTCFAQQANWSWQMGSGGGKKHKKYSKDELNKVLDIKSYPDYEKDNARLKEINREYYNHGNYLNDLTKPANDFQKACEDTAALAKKYRDYWNASLDYNNMPGEMYNMYNETQAKMNDFKKYMAQNYSGTDVLAKKEIEKIISETEESAKSKHNITASRFGGEYSNIDFYIAAIRMLKGTNDATAMNLQTQAEDSKKKIETMNAEVNQKYEAEQQADKKEREEKEKKEFEEKAASTKCPKEIYAGADKETLRKNLTAAWKTDMECKDYKLLKVIFHSANWEKKKGTQYERNANNTNEITGTDFNYSFLEVMVVFQMPDDAPEIANMFEAEVAKDNINKTVAYNFICRKVDSFEPILTKNVK